MSPVSFGDIDWYNLGRHMEIESVPTTEADRENLKAVSVMLGIARQRPPRKREPFYKAAGQHLEMLHRGKPTEVWAELVRKHVGIGLARAYELVELGAGRKTLAELRQAKNAASRRWKSMRIPKKRKTEMGTEA